MALRTRHISFILHLSEVKFTTRLVILMDIDGLRWVPMNPIGFHSKNGYRRVPSDNISALFDFHLTSGTLSRQTYFTPVKVLRKEFCLFHRKKYISYGCVLEMYGKKSISTLPNRELGKCNEIRNN